MDNIGRVITERASTLGLSMATLAESTGLARSTLYKILAGRSADPSVSTVQRLAVALQLSPMVLFRAFAELQNLPRSKGGSETSVVESRVNSGDIVAFTRDVTVPDHAAVVPGEQFEKSWEIQNLGQVPWVGRRFVRIDDDLVIARRVGARLEEVLASHLHSPARTMDVPFTAPGMPCRISMQFTAPMENCSVASLWRMQTSDGRWAFPHQFFLQVIVTVMGE